jgi:hypothetical protein
MQQMKLYKQNRTPRNERLDEEGKQCIKKTKRVANGYNTKPEQTKNHTRKGE